MIDADEFESVCRAMEAGMHKTAALKMLGIEPRFFTRYLKGNPSARSRYDEAREAFTDAEMDLMGDLAMDRSLNPGMVRNRADHARWRAQREDRARYGERVEVNMTGVPNIINVLAERDANMVSWRERPLLRHRDPITLDNQALRDARLSGPEPLAPEGEGVD
jgi:hypothetical protein